MKILRILLAICAVCLLAYATRGHAHKVFPLDKDTAAEISGPQFTENAARDQYIYKDGQTRDRFSLTPEKATVDDCPT